MTVWCRLVRVLSILVQMPEGRGGDADQQSAASRELRAAALLTFVARVFDVRVDDGLVALELTHPAQSARPAFQSRAQLSAPAAALLATPVSPTP